MSTPARSPARLCLLALCAAWVGADAEEKTSDPVIGGVYVARQLSEDSSRTERASVWPLAALRVDDRRSDTLLVKYTVAPEPLANADFRYESACDCFKSKEDLAFGVFSGWRREFKIEYEEVFLKFKPGELDLWYFEDGEMRGPYDFRMTYVDTVNLSTHRHPYYAEIGFSLFPHVSRHEAGATWPAPEVIGCRRVPSADADDAPPAMPTSRSGPQDGESFRDCADCPEMVAVPAGRFWMGCEWEGAFSEYEQPSHEVTIARRFALSKYETTFAQWDACVARGGCEGYRPVHYGKTRDDRAVGNVNREDVQNYLSWLSEKTGKRYRLPSEAEWEYAARAGTVTRYSWGDDVGWNQANCHSCNSREPGPLPVGSFPANAFGLHDMHGNVFEWVEDCWNSSYDGAPSDGSAWLAGDCSVRVVRGGAWRTPPYSLRSAFRDSYRRPYPDPDIGFRVALTLP